MASFYALAGCIILQEIAVAERSGLSNLLENQFSQNQLQFSRCNSNDVVPARLGEAKHSQVPRQKFWMTGKYQKNWVP
jgi:hypothetical protein